MSDSGRVGAAGEHARDAENVLKRMGYSRVVPTRREPITEASFWVQESGVPRRTFPVYVPGARGEVDAGIDRWVEVVRGTPQTRRAIFVVPNDTAAEAAWARLSRAPGSTIDHEVSILVVPNEARANPPPHFHLRSVPPKEVLRVATGVVVGLFRRAQSSDGSTPVDFEEMLVHLKHRFGIDVQRSLGVGSDEDALFLLYQLALRDSYAPGDPGANLHLLVLKPTGPAARLPWFAA
ncbi:MAG: hypothetical protein L3J92_01960 [Thermoplasmata archaeon]|jgi:hypothetical protein|nr:hypothetical protein [Thermoplasmata archaeon]